MRADEGSGLREAEKGEEGPRSRCHVTSSEDVSAFHTHPGWSVELCHVPPE